MKLEKFLILAIVLIAIISGIVYFTLPEAGERVFIPQITEDIPDEIVIPEGYKKVDNFDDVYYLETEDGIRFFWLVKYTDGTYGWQEVDKDGNLIVPGHTEETTPEESSEPTETTEPTESSAPQSESTESTSEPASE